MLLTLRGEATAKSGCCNSQRLQNLKLWKPSYFCCECWHCSMLCSFLQTGASTKVVSWPLSHSSISPGDSFWHKVWGVYQAQAFSVINIAKRHCSLIWLLKRMETVNRMVLPQWSVADTCMCTLYFVQSRAKCHLVVLPWSLCNTSVFSYWQIILSKLLGWMSPSHQRGTYSLQLLEKLTRNPGSCKTREVTRKPCLVAALDKQVCYEPLLGYPRIPNMWSFFQHKKVHFFKNWIAMTLQTGDPLAPTNLARQ